MTDSATQRTNMVESQIRPSDVTDRRILRAMQLIARERYVPSELAQLAYMDDQVPLNGTGGLATTRRLISPRTLAKLLQAADIEEGDAVLDVGAGRGYGAAILAQLARTVIALECDQDLAAAARSALAAQPKVTVVTGQLPAGSTSHGPFNVIVLEGAVFEPPVGLLTQLAPGGRLVGVIQDGAIGRAALWRNTGGHCGRKDLFEASVTALPGFERKLSFVF